jgi:toxin ParE1/3/4
MNVAFTAEAAADLESIGDHIARENPARALSFLQEIRAACMALGTTPFAFPLVPRYEHQGIRRRVLGNYLIFFRIEADQLVVIHILHGAMDYAPILFPM